MADKQRLSLLKKSPNLCEVSTEYPALKGSFTPRHLCTSIMPEPSSTIHIDKLSSNTVRQKHDRHVKEPKTCSNNVEEQTEIIILFEYKQVEEINDKLYKKSRYRLTKTTNSDESEEEHDTI